MTYVAGACAVLLGLGFGIPGIIGARHFAMHGEVWQLLGFPTYGDGPFAHHGLPTSVPLLLGFVLVCAAEVVVGALLLAGWHGALWVQFALLPFELAYWWGFALPYALVLGAVRVVAAAVALATSA